MLERKGFLRRDPNRPRAVDVRSPGEPLGGKSRRRARSSADAAAQRACRSSSRWSGRIAAGGPILAEEMIEDVLPAAAQPGR